MDDIRHQVIELLADLRNYPSDEIDLVTSIIDDLGVAGDDADDLFLAFDERFGIDSSKLDYKKYFGSEGMWPWEAALALWFIVWGLLRLIVGLPFARKIGSENDMKVSDLVEAATSKKWNEKFEIAEPRRD